MTNLRTWVWWAFEQFAVLFLPAPSVLDEVTGEMRSCSTCWWYRGVAFGVVVGAVLAATLVSAL